MRLKSYHGEKIWCSIKSPDRIVKEDLQTRVSDNDLTTTSAIDIVIGADGVRGQERCTMKIIMHNNQGKKLH